MRVHVDDGEAARSTGLRHDQHAARLEILSASVSVPLCAAGAAGACGSPGRRRGVAPTKPAPLRANHARRLNRPLKTPSFCIPRSARRPASAASAAVAPKPRHCSAATPPCVPTPPIFLDNPSGSGEGFARRGSSSAPPASVRKKWRRCNGLSPQPRSGTHLCTDSRRRRRGQCAGRPRDDHRHRHRQLGRDCGRRSVKAVHVATNFERTGGHVGSRHLHPSTAPSRTLCRHRDSERLSNRPRSRTSRSPPAAPHASTDRWPLAACRTRSRSREKPGRFRATASR